MWNTHTIILNSPSNFRKMVLPCFFDKSKNFNNLPTLTAFTLCLVAQSGPALVTLWTVTHQAPLSEGFSRQEHWSGLPCPPPGDLPHPGIKPSLPHCNLDRDYRCDVNYSLHFPVKCNIS